METGSWKVGQLAKRTGISVRTLHYYDEIGLLSPSHHTPSGHRLYTSGDVARPHQIVSLRQLGFALGAIRECLDGDGFSPRRVIGLHVARLEAAIETQRRLCERLKAIAASLDAAEDVSAETLIRTIEEMKAVEKYYTQEQLDTLQERRKQVGEARIREVEAEWPALMAEVRAEMEKGTDPASERVRELARRWMGLVEEFTGGDPAIAASAKSMWQNESSIHGMDTSPMREMMGYIQRALAAEKRGN
jgi:DNA-binding transcriptional MerR regulator